MRKKGAVQAGKPRGKFVSDVTIQNVKESMDQLRGEKDALAERIVEIKEAEAERNDVEVRIRELTAGNPGLIYSDLKKATTVGMRRMQRGVDEDRISERAAEALSNPFLLRKTKPVYYQEPRCDTWLLLALIVATGFFVACVVYPWGPAYGRGFVDVDGYLCDVTVEGGSYDSVLLNEHEFFARHSDACPPVYDMLYESYTTSWRRFGNDLSLVGLKKLCLRLTFGDSCKEHSFGRIGEKLLYSTTWLMTACTSISCSFVLWLYLLTKFIRSAVLSSRREWSITHCKMVIVRRFHDALLAKLEQYRRLDREEKLREFKSVLPKRRDAVSVAFAANCYDVARTLRSEYERVKDLRNPLMLSPVFPEVPIWCEVDDRSVIDRTTDAVARLGLKEDFVVIDCSLCNESLDGDSLLIPQKWEFMSAITSAVFEATSANIVGATDREHLLTLVKGNVKRSLTAMGVDVSTALSGAYGGTFDLAMLIAEDNARYVSLPGF